MTTELFTTVCDATPGDETGFEEVVRRHGPMVLRVCGDILGDRDHAEEAFQATFLVLVRRGGTVRDRLALGRWLYAVASRISRRERCRRARLRARERQLPTLDAAAPSGLDLADGDLKPILHEEIDRLPRRLRDAVILCYLEGLTVEQAARRLGCPAATLKSRLGKARELLRSRLTRRGLAASALLLLLFSLTEEAQAAVPGPLLEATVKGTRHGLDHVTVTRRVASMVLEEEERWRRARLLASWALLLALTLATGASRQALRLRAADVPAAPPDAPSLFSAFVPADNPPPAAGDHCLTH